MESCELEWMEHLKIQETKLGAESLSVMPSISSSDWRIAQILKIFHRKMRVSCLSIELEKVQSSKVKFKRMRPVLKIL
ncbi:hypothetical protein C0J52_13515 [Blattella germanica]|nr:hypothetical protein C0J52_13515 [Blattella germanica]